MVPNRERSTPRLYIVTLITSFKMQGWMKHKLESRLPEEIPITSDDTTLTAGSEELKRLLMKVTESEKVGLKLNIQKMKIMASNPITSWQIDGETMKTVRDFIFLGSKITADSDCSMKFKNTCSLEEKL